jgi:hypothetical protein
VKGSRKASLALDEMAMRNPPIPEKMNCYKGELTLEKNKKSSLWARWLLRNERKKSKVIDCKSGADLSFQRNSPHPMLFTPVKKPQTRNNALVVSLINRSLFFLSWNKNSLASPLVAHQLGKLNGIDFL